MGKFSSDRTIRETSGAPRRFSNLNQEFNLFSIGVGVGRALNRRLLVTGGYVHYVAGERTFNQALVVGVSFIWGEEKVKPEVSKTLKSASLGVPANPN